MNTLRLLIADSSPVYRKMFSQAVTELDKEANIVCVKGSDEVLDNIKSCNFDVIVIDVEIAGQDIAAFFKKIIHDIPKALILVTAQPSSVSEKLRAEAMAEGVFDCMVKPIYDNYSSNFEFVKLKMSEILAFLLDERKKKKTLPVIDPAEANKNFAKSSLQNCTLQNCRLPPEIVLIAVSTGGPRALESVLTKLPGDFPVPVLIVQHMPAHFINTLAGHLDNISRLKVKVAEDREKVAAGTVYMAPGGIHMKLDARDRILLDDSPPQNGIRPAADVLFNSVAESFSGSNVLAVILTGMGSDGKKGLASLKEKRNCLCFVQSEETCVVYGMPFAAVESGLADKIVALDDLSAEIESLFSIPGPGAKKTGSI